MKRTEKPLDRSYSKVTKNNGSAQKVSGITILPRVHSNNIIRSYLQSTTEPGDGYNSVEPSTRRKGKLIDMSLQSLPGAKKISNRTRQKDTKERYTTDFEPYTNSTSLDKQTKVSYELLDQKFNIKVKAESGYDDTTTSPIPDGRKSNMTMLGYKNAKFTPLPISRISLDPSSKGQTL